MLSPTHSIEYSCSISLQLMVVHADNVGSRQMQKIRIALRGKGQLLMGKNTMMRKVHTGQFCLL